MSSFQVWMYFIAFSYLNALARTSSIMLNRSGKGGHPFLVPDLKRETSNFSLQSMMLAFTVLGYNPSIPNLLVLYHKRMLNFVTCLFCTSFHSSFCGVSHILIYNMLNHSCTAEINLT